jgi:predicted ATP-grasp superfamily ATP-dependent carboligase
VSRAPRATSSCSPARTFCETVVELAEALGVQLVVTLGALLADVPHSRPVHVSAYASDDALVNRLGLAPPTYEGPTGIVGVLHDACASAGMPSASLWAAVPHYVAVVPNPKGALALLRRLESLIGVTVDAAELEDAAAEYERQVSRAVEMDPDVQAFVEKLERAADEEERSSEQTPLPSGDVLAREFQRFLRQRGTPPGDR